METKICRKCNVAKLKGEFYEHRPRNGIRQSKDGLDSWCKQCHRDSAIAWGKKNHEKKLALVRAWYAKNGYAYYKKNVALYGQRAFASRLKINFGITPEDYDRMFEAQRGICKICGKKNGKRRLVVDHCHNTDKVRGLLCGKCNRGIGYLNDSIELLEAAIRYLKA